MSKCNYLDCEWKNRWQNWVMANIFLFLKKKGFYFNWRTITWQYHDGFCHTSIWIGHRYTCVASIVNHPAQLPPHPLSPDCHRALALGALLHVANSHWLPALHVVLHMFQCCSLKSSHPLPLPLSPKICSLHLCLLCRPVHRIIGTIF